MDGLFRRVLSCFGTSTWRKQMTAALKIEDDIVFSLLEDIPSNVIDDVDYLDRLLTPLARRARPHEILRLCIIILDRDSVVDKRVFLKIFRIMSAVNLGKNDFNRCWGSSSKSLVEKNLSNFLNCFTIDTPRDVLGFFVFYSCIFQRANQEQVSYLANKLLCKGDFKNIKYLLVASDILPIGWIAWIFLEAERVCRNEGSKGGSLSCQMDAYLDSFSPSELLVFVFLLNKDAALYGDFLNRIFRSVANKYYFSVFLSFINFIKNPPFNIEQNSADRVAILLDSSFCHKLTISSWLNSYNSGCSSEVASIENFVRHRFEKKHAIFDKLSTSQSVEFCWDPDEGIGANFGCIRDVDALISFVNSDDLIRLRSYATEGVVEIRLGRVASDEKAKIISTQEIMVEHNSPLDLESARMSWRCAEEIFKIITDSDSDSDSDSEFFCEFTKDVLSVAFGDRIFPGIKLSNSVIGYLTKNKCRKVCIVLHKSRLNNAFELAYALKLIGISVTFNFSTLATSSLESLWSFLHGSRDFENLLCLMALHQIPFSQSSKLPVVNFSPTSFSTKVEEENYLIVASLGDHQYSSTALSVFNELSKIGNVEIYNGGTGGGEEFFKKAGCRPSVFSENKEYGDSVFSSIRYIFERFCEKHNELNDCERQVVANFSRVVNSCVMAITSEYEKFDQLSKLFSEKNFKGLVVVPGRMPSSRTAIAMAKAANIRSLDVQAFFMSDHPRYLASTADIYCGICDSQIDIYKRKPGIPMNQLIFNVGSLLIDENLNRVRLVGDVEDESPLFNVNVDHVFLYCAQHGTGEDGWLSMRYVIRAANLIENSGLVIKMHPRSDAVVVSKALDIIAEESGVNVVVRQSGDIYSYIAKSNVVITGFSNVGIEAAVLGRPVLSINLTGERFVVDLAEMGIAASATTENEVFEKLHSIIFCKSELGNVMDSADKFFRRNLQLRDGASVKRLVSYLCGDC